MATGPRLSGVFNSIPAFFKKIFRTAGDDLAAWMTGSVSSIPLSALPPSVGAPTVTDPKDPWTAVNDGDIADQIGQKAVSGGECYIQLLSPGTNPTDWQSTTADTAGEIVVTLPATNYTAATQDVEAHLTGIHTEVGSLDGRIDTLESATEIQPYALTDETTPLTTGQKLQIIAQEAFTVAEVSGSVTTTSSSGTVIIDIHKNGVSMLTANKINIDALQKDSRDAAVQPGILTAAWAQGDEITFEIDSAGTGATGAKVYIRGS